MPDGYDNDVWNVLLEQPPASLTPLAQRLIGHGLKSLYSPVLTDEPTDRLAKLVDMLKEAPSLDPSPKKLKSPAGRTKQSGFYPVPPGRGEC